MTCGITASRHRYIATFVVLLCVHHTCHACRDAVMGVTARSYTRDREEKPCQAMMATILSRKPPRPTTTQRKMEETEEREDCMDITCQGCQIQLHPQRADHGNGEVTPHFCPFTRVPGTQHRVTYGRRPERIDAELGRSTSPR